MLVECLLQLCVAVLARRQVSGRGGLFETGVRARVREPHQVAFGRGQEEVRKLRLGLAGQVDAPVHGVVVRSKDIRDVGIRVTDFDLDVDTAWLQH